MLTKREPELKRVDAVEPDEMTNMDLSTVYSFMDTSANGLSHEQVEERLNTYGENSVNKEKTFHPIKSFVKNFFNLFAIMLWIGSILAWISGTPILSYVIWFIIFMNAIFSFVQESKADKALQALSKMMPDNVKVYRENQLNIISARELVPGDIIILKAGDKVPADVRIVEADHLLVDNSMLTGESLPVERYAESNIGQDNSVASFQNLLYGGSTITAGTGKGVVYATGNHTQIGNLTETTSHIKKGKSTLEIQIQRITKILGCIAIAIGIIAFFISIFVTEFTVNAALIFTIGIIVANIPEGLMPTVSLSLAMSVQRMAKKNALVRKQSAIETLSSTSIICTDKTGTLTQNSMVVKKIWTPDGTVSVSGNGYAKSGEITGITSKNRDTIEKLFVASIICSDTVLQTDQDNPAEWSYIGNPTEAALLIAAEKFGLQTENVKGQFERRKMVPFSSEKKTMTVWAVPQHQNVYPPDQEIVFIKGDPVKVINQCKYFVKDGQIKEMNDRDREEALLINDEMAKEGYRILATTYSASPLEPEAAENQYVLLGMSAMYDPPKEGVKQAIEDCYRAGMKVTVVTGDYSVTAVEIAKQIGIIKDEYLVITGPEVEAMTKEELQEKLDTEKPVIFSRTIPKHKLKIVESYQGLGQVVASTGDGINDVLALKKADIGISMGQKGSDAAIEASDVVLLDDNFATIVEAIKEGRAIYYNIQKFITYILASNVPEVLPFIVMGLFNFPLALPILLVLAIDLGTDLIPAISLGEELPDQDVLNDPPRNRKSNILDRRVIFRAYTFLGLIEAAMLFVMFIFTWNHFGYSINEIHSFTASIENGTASEHIKYVYNYAVTLAFGAVVACQIGNVLVCRSNRLSIFQSMKKKNRLMIWGIVLEVILFLVIAYVPLFQEIFNTVGPKFNHIIVLLICPVVLILLEEFRKWAVRRR